MVFPWARGLSGPKLLAAQAVTVWVSSLSGGLKSPGAGAGYPTVLSRGCTSVSCRQRSPLQIQGFVAELLFTFLLGYHAEYHGQGEGSRQAPA